MGKTMALSEDGEIIALRAFPFYAKDSIKSSSRTFCILRRSAALDAEYSGQPAAIAVGQIEN